MDEISRKCARYVNIGHCVTATHQRPEDSCEHNTRSESGESLLGGQTCGLADLSLPLLQESWFWDGLGRYFIPQVRTNAIIERPHGSAPLEILNFVAAYRGPCRPNKSHGSCCVHGRQYDQSNVVLTRKRDHPGVNTAELHHMHHTTIHPLCPWSCGAKSEGAGSGVAPGVHRGYTCDVLPLQPQPTG